MDATSTDDLDELCPSDGREAETNYFYGYLGLKKDATVDEIKRAYRKQAAVMHPDKHTDEKKKAIAQDSFQRLQKIYEVLVDPDRRAAYDEVGFDAVKYGPLVHGSPQAELRRKFERLAKKQQRSAAKEQHHSSGITKVVLIPQQHRAEARAWMPDSVRTELETSHYVESRIAESTYVMSDLASDSTGGQMPWIASVGARHVCRAVDGGRRHQGWMRCAVGAHRVAEADIGAEVSLGDFTSLKALVHVDNGTGSALSVAASRIMSSALVFYSSCCLGADRGFHAGGEWCVGDKHVRDTAKIALRPELRMYQLAGAGLTLTASRQTKRSRFALTAGVSALTGFAYSIAVQQRFTRTIRLGVQLDVSPTQLVLTPSIQLHSQTLEVPIPFLFAPTAGAMVGATAATLLFVRLFKALLVLPFERRRRAVKVAAARDRGERYVADARARAEEATVLMADSVASKRRREEECGGLVVVEARYGVLDDDDKSIDVTTAVQYHVENGVLELRSTAPKSQLAGFYDCALGEEKQLSLRYLYKNKLLYNVVDDTEPLLLPSQ